MLGSPKREAFAAGAHDPHDLVGILVAAVRQVADEVRPIAALASLGNLHLAPAAKRLENHE